jgi:hypothetical protein
MFIGWKNISFGRTFHLEEHFSKARREAQAKGQLLWLEMTNIPQVEIIFTSLKPFT